MNRYCFLSVILMTGMLMMQLNTLAQDDRGTGININLNDHWKFHPGGVAFANRTGQKGYPEGVDECWETVTLPHTWNAHDPFDDEVSYARGIGWYRKYLFLDSTLSGKQVFLKFEGANQRTELYINGAFVGQHKGGYTGFTFDISAFIRPGEENLVAVMVDNSHDNTIAPLSVGYALYGGIYRDVWLVVKEPVHFMQTHYGSSGLYVSTPEVSEKEAGVNIRSIIQNRSEVEKFVEIRHTVLNDAGEKVLELSGDVHIPAGGCAEPEPLLGVVNNPRLWSPEHPDLYAVHSRIIVDGIVSDETISPLGFRWFSIDPGHGFMLNGEKYIIKGTNRHQDFEGLGCALPDSQHIKDLEWIKNMGANFVRLAHYPQDPEVLRAADRLGLMVWVEVPNVNYIVPSPEMTQNSANQLKEMIYQGFNHPSVIFWGSTNEIFLWDKTAERKSNIEDPVYRGKVRDFVFTMDSIIRVTDPGRISTLAIHGSKDYDIEGITGIPQMLSVNHYSGWYSGTFPGFGGYLDSRHRRFPDEVLFVSEYGAGGDTRINTTAPQRFDFSGQYQQMYHKSYLEQINQRKYLAGTAIWNQFDFSQPHTGGSIYHINQKGVQKWDRTPKDVYYFYKANWNPEPMVYIASRNWTNRTGWSGNATHSLLLNTQPVSVYSNMKEVELFVNGKSLGKKQPDDLKEVTWEVSFKEGVNSLKAEGISGDKVKEDILGITFKKYDLDLNKEEELAINVGHNCEFGEYPGKLWLPDQTYRIGHYGAVDGRAGMIDKDIIIRDAGDREPVFNYFIEGISEYRLDITDGIYEVHLLFAEGKVLRTGERVFDVAINGEAVLENFDMIDANGFGRAIEKTFRIKVSGGEGLKISFNAKKDKPLLNGIKLSREDK